MQFEEILNYFTVVKRGNGTAQCRSPLRKDSKPSLSLTKGADGRTLVHDFGDPRDGKTVLSEIAAAVGLKESDFFSDEYKTRYNDRSGGSTWRQDAEKRADAGYKTETSYDYYNIETGEYALTKVRYQSESGDKDFRIGTVKDGRFRVSSQRNPVDRKTAVYGNVNRIKAAAETGEYVFITEGEKDTDTLSEYGYIAYTAGSSSDQKKYATTLANLAKGANIVILADNDKPGKDAAAAVLKECQKTAKTVKVIIPDKEREKADITDYFTELHKTREEFDSLVASADDSAAVSSNSGILASLTVLSAVEKKAAEWLIPGYIPKGQITLIAGDGGSGKGFLWCDIAAAVSTGRASVLDKVNPFTSDEVRPAQKVLYFSSEDSTQVVIKQRLEDAGANMDNIITVGIDSPDFPSIRFASPELKTIIETTRPALVIFDPLQSFLADGTMMNQRHSMRTNLNPLVEYGERFGCTFIIIMHTNKLSGVWGRKRLADSADVWDIARSVFLVGYTGEEKDRYISHEKSNYGEQLDTVLYRITDGAIEYLCTSDKKDRDFILAAPGSGGVSDQRREAADYILAYLRDEPEGKAPAKDIDDACKACGYTQGAVRYAKSSLKEAGKIRISNKGFGGKWSIELVKAPVQKQTEKTAPDDSTPFT